MVFRFGLLACLTGEMKDDVQKLDFTIKALAMDDPFVSIPVVHADIRECLDWQKSRSADVIMKERELMTQQIESSGCKLWESGSCADWFTGTDPGVAFIAREVNGPLCEELVKK